MKGEEEGDEEEEDKDKDKDKDKGKGKDKGKDKGKGKSNGAAVARPVRVRVPSMSRPCRFGGAPTPRRCRGLVTSAMRPRRGQFVPTSHLRRV